MPESPSAAVVNQAIQLIGNNQILPVTGAAPNFDSSTSGVAAANLYAPCVRTVLREFGFDFSRNTVALTLTGNPAPFPWTYEYNYPPNGVQVRQVTPQSVADPNNPIPVNWEVANDIVNGQQVRVVLCNLENAQAVYTNQPVETAWDDTFREAVVRLLASELAMALEGRPETMTEMFESSAQFTQIAAQRDS